MPQRSQRHYSLDEYFAVEETSQVKNEFYNGEIFAMAGASLKHNRIVVNIVSLLAVSLRGSGCEVFGSDLRLQTPSGLFTYPDITVLCGEPVLLPDRPDTLTNPVMLIEVLSEATREYDQGQKFELYKEIPTLRDYLLIEQDRPFVQHFHLSPDGIWIRQTSETIQAELTVASLQVTIPLLKVY